MCILRFRLYNIDKSIGEYDISESEKIVLWKAVSYNILGLLYASTIILVFMQQ